MLAGFLTVLKIIGTVLLVILAVVLFMILLVLFVPIRYRLDMEVPETEISEGFDTDKLFLKAKFSWLLHILSGGIVYPEKKQFEIKVFGIRVFPLKEKPEKEEKSGKQRGKNKNEEKKTDTVTKEDNWDKLKKKEEEKAEDITENEAEGMSEESEDEKSFLDVLWDIIDGAAKLIETPQNVFEKFRYTISRVCDKIDMIKITVESDIFKRAFRLVKDKLIKIIRMLLPKKTDIKLLFGTGDPAQTAELMGVYGALYPVIYDKVSLEPDFERQVVAASVHLKGRVTTFTILYSAIVCYFNRDVKKVIRRFKKILSK